MPILIILYTIPAFFIVLGIVKIIRSFFTSSKDTDYFGGGTYIFLAVFWIFSAVFIIGTPNEFLKEKADKEARDNEIIKNCKLVETGRKGGLLSANQDGYLCKDGVVYYINTQK
ncbi:TPA: hypothetical protein QHS83_004492 [Klebsiella pneumoniae subsp. pneumoniae]|uniref:hypothetical protein n=1 Tax=Escherichia coli TaxID=562 RepID=UPI000DE4E994|nr:hypothetical protein [Escherichia coli]HDS2567761.1 hypothetical protein [Klebsiella pneumoniae subsp. pneumoniae]HDT1491310.1 hypothetical protein [Klebsiella pneumoniae subsp. pneumoniae]HDT2776620.1 hypothetical protein [Escherichia coli]HDT3847135.1 hypothetical protein [Escherichia coli]